MKLGQIFYQVGSHKHLGTVISVPEGDVLQNILSIISNEEQLLDYLKEYCTKHYNMNHNDIISTNDVSYVSFEINFGNYAIKN